MDTENTNVMEGLAVVIPIYNVEKYLDDCLESVCNQSVEDFDIILVNDGSTDKSGLICEKWVLRDKRIKYYYKENEGLGPTREYGMLRSRRKYVTFVDSDDWLADDFVEKMMDRVMSTNADVVYCDCCYVNEITKDRYIDRFRKNLDSVDADMNVRLAFGYPNMWAAVYNKELWIKNDIHMPGIVYEDTAVYGVMLYYAKKVAYCSETLYYYRTSRPGSLMQVGIKDYTYMVKALEHLLNLAKVKNILSKNKTAFLDFCIKQISGDWMRLIVTKDIHRQKDLLKDMDAFLENYFGNWKELSCQDIAAFGSYNSSAVYNDIKAFRKFREGKLQYVSMIIFLTLTRDTSALNIRDGAREFQKEMLLKELTTDIRDILKNYRVIIFDLLDEQFDIIKIGDSYINLSNAFNDTIEVKEACEHISRDSEKCFNLWKKGFDSFVSFAKKENIQLIMLKLYYNESYGNETEQIEYENVEDIRKKNRILQKYYVYISERYPDLRFVELPNKFRFTDRYFRYGIKPEHFNMFAYFYLAYLVRHTIRQNSGLIN